MLLSCSPTDPLSEMIPDQDLQQLQKTRSSVPRVIDHTQIKDPNVIKVSEGRNLECTQGADQFRLTYFDAQANAYWQCYDKKELVTALINAGVPIADAVQRGYTIFHTAYTSGQYLGETAGLIGPNEVPSFGNNYTGNIFYLLDNGTCQEGCIPTSPLPGPTPVPLPSPEVCPQGDITAAAYMKGISGNVLYNIANAAWVVMRSACDPTVNVEVDLDLQGIEHSLSQAQWTDLLVGNYTEREFFDLYQQRIAPVLLANHPQVDLSDPCWVMETAYFRSNYLYNGVFGHTIAYVRGSARVRCGVLPDVEG